MEEHRHPEADEDPHEAQGATGPEQEPDEGSHHPQLRGCVHVADEPEAKGDEADTGDHLQPVGVHAPREIEHGGGKDRGDAKERQGRCGSVTHTDETERQDRGADDPACQPSPKKTAHGSACSPGG